MKWGQESSGEKGTESIALNLRENSLNHGSSSRGGEKWFDSVYIYVCMCVRVCVYMYVCVYIYMERERKRVEFANGSDMGWKKKNGVKNDSSESFEERQEL